MSWLEDVEKLCDKNKRTGSLHSEGARDYRF
jgi:hypothetical protein